MTFPLRVTAMYGSQLGKGSLSILWLFAKEVDIVRTPNKTYRVYIFILEIFDMRPSINPGAIKQNVGYDTGLPDLGEAFPQLWRVGNVGFEHCQLAPQLFDCVSKKIRPRVICKLYRDNVGASFG